MTDTICRCGTDFPAEFAVKGIFCSSTCADEFTPSGVYFCKYCGELAGERHYSHDARLRANRHCFNCDYWFQLVEQAKSSDWTKSIRVNGVHRVARPMSSAPPKHRGQGGGRYFRHGSGAVVESNDVWYQGRIPHIFRALLPDNAEIISKAQYEDVLRSEAENEAAHDWAEQKDNGWVS